MADYRLYSLDRNGHIDFADWIIATTDADAIAQARALHPHARQCEVWLKSRLVANITDGECERAST